MWRSIMNFLNLCGVVSNALLVAYTSAFCSDYFGDNVSAKERLSTLVIFEVSSDFTALILFIIIESSKHLALAIAYILSVSIPDVPSHIVLAQKKERHQVAKLLENAAATYPFPRRSETELRRNPSLTEIGRTSVQQRSFAGIRLSPIRPTEMRKFADGTTSNDTLDTSLQEDSSR